MLVTSKHLTLDCVFLKRKCRPLLRTLCELNLKRSSGFGTCSSIPSSHAPKWPLSLRSALQMPEFQRKKTLRWSTNTKEDCGVITRRPAAIWMYHRAWNCTILLVLSLYRTRCPHSLHRIWSPRFIVTLELQSPQT